MICSTQLPTLNEQFDEAALAVGEQIFTSGVKAQEINIDQQVVTQMLHNWAAFLRQSAERKQAEQLEEERRMDAEQERQGLGPHSTDIYGKTAHAAVLDPEIFYNPERSGRRSNTNSKDIPHSRDSWNTRVHVPEEQWDDTWKTKKELRSSRKLRKRQDGSTSGSQSAWRRAAERGCRWYN